MSVPRPNRWPAALVALALLAGGCGKRGRPHPPDPRGPLPPREVHARQVGDEVWVTFRSPSPRGEKRSQQPVRAELVRVDYAPGVDPPVDVDAFRRRGVLVMVEEADPLEADRRLWLTDAGLSDLPARGVGSTVRYAVRVRDRRGRGSPLVVATDLVPLATTAPPRDPKGVVEADGVRLSWRSPDDGAHAYNVYRWDLGEPEPDQPLNAKPVEALEYLDGGVDVGRDYAYAIRVALDPGRPFRESAGSSIVRVRTEDRFAPASPTGLVAVQEGAAVRLFWNPGTERDLAGYRVYRRLDGDWLRIGPDPVDRPLFLDDTVSVGQRPEYRVTAIDRADPPNESEPSEIRRLELLAEPLAGGSVAP